MCACGEEGEDAILFDTVKALGLELCPTLGLSIPVGKDSLSMRTTWKDSHGKNIKMTAPLSLIITAFAPVTDVRLTVTPDLKPVADSSLILVDLGRGQNRLGASVLAQVYNQVGGNTPDVDRPADLAAFFAAVQELVQGGLLLAYHDRSDGGLFATVAEMAFAGRQGVHLHLDEAEVDPLRFLFTEELGAVLQVADGNLTRVNDILGRHGLGDLAMLIGGPAADKTFSIEVADRVIVEERLAVLNQAWSELTCEMQARRDNADCARQEFEDLKDETDPGLTYALTYEPAATFAIGGARPRMAIFREQGVNGHLEMAAAFERAGFDSFDVHMTDLLGGRVDLKDFAGLAACGGFSYGDVLGAGAGWARSILFNERLRDMFTAFFARPDTFALGVCNGCQMMSLLKDIIPGAEHWPRFTRNVCEQFEARYVNVEILRSPSIFFRGMEGSRLGIPVAHGEGFANFAPTGSLEGIRREGLAAMRFVDHHGRPATRYPLNPNGSPDGLTSVTNRDGRVTILMPHPERAFRAVQLSWKPDGLFKGDAGPWLRMFQNARAFAR
jgi:phosphoribosylformylglycinamidine synthase